MKRKPNPNAGATSTPAPQRGRDSADGCPGLTSILVISIIVLNLALVSRFVASDARGYAPVGPGYAVEWPGVVDDQIFKGTCAKCGGPVITMASPVIAPWAGRKLIIDFTVSKARCLRCGTYQIIKVSHGMQ